MTLAVEPCVPADPSAQRRLSEIDESIPVLWLCGPPGVGKSTVAWQIFTDLQRAGTMSGFVDIDQLGICYPELPDDPGRHRMQVANLAAVVDSYRAAGARCVVVSGVVDREHGVDRDRLRDVELTWCRFRADRGQLIQRLRDRGEVQYDLDEVWREAELLDRGNIIDGAVVDTTDLRMAEVVRQVRAQIGAWPGSGAARGSGEMITPRISMSYGGAGGTILWLCGPTAVGKSAVGFQIFMRQVGDGIAAAFVDLDQIGFFCGPNPIDEPTRHRLTAANLAAVWRTYHAAGAACLVVVGPASSASDIDRYVEALPGVTFTVVRMHAEPEELTRRIALRGDGRGWAQPGDPLRGQPVTRLSDVARATIADNAALEAARVGDLRVDTTSLSVGEAADAVLERTGWPGKDA